MPDYVQPDALIDTAVHALTSDAPCRAVLDQFPVPFYTTDAEGTLTYWNPACAEFAGREPDVGHDRWCVTAALYTIEGQALPHEHCPMANALRQRRPIRDAIAIAERPDGSRRAFKPYPTPLFGADGELLGGLNLLIDVTDEQCEELSEQAARCRRLASATYDRRTSHALGSMAEDFERSAQGLRSGEP